MGIASRLSTWARLATAVGLGCLLALQAESSGVGGPQRSLPSQLGPRIDLDHILEGGINRRGELVGLHHEPSAPATIKFERIEHEVVFRYTSPGDKDDVRTARVELRDPATGRVALSKFSTCYPAAWTAEKIEGAIREAFDDAHARDRIERNGKWEGRTESGMRIDGYLSRDSRWISTAFPVYIPPRRDRNAPPNRNAPAQPSGSRRP